MGAQEFGGAWTEQKLQALQDYLGAYLRIFTTNPKAVLFTRHYVDAFAGSGVRQTRQNARTIPLELDESLAYMDGSVRKVLSLRQEFHRYWFVETDSGHADSLRARISADFPNRANSCQINVQDANEFLVTWSRKLQPMDRAVVFLDPFGMAVRWSTIEALADTGKVDLWMLFPCSAVIRMLPRARPPQDAWHRKLTELFGDDSWLEHFYRESGQADLFDESASMTRGEIDAQSVAKYLLRRMKTLFPGVVDQPLVLYNSRNSPLYLLVFAAGNPKGCQTAVRIASYIIRTA